MNRFFLGRREEALGWIVSQGLREGTCRLVVLDDGHMDHEGWLICVLTSRNTLSPAYTIEL